MTLPLLRFKKLHPQAQIPKRWSPEAVGLDLHAHIISDSGRLGKAMVPPHTTHNIGTGLALEPPEGYFIWVVPRSGLGKYSISVTNSPGTIDPDYRGEIRVLLFNGGYSTFYVEHGMRIAQLVVVPRILYNIAEVSELSPTERGERGFGSTGQ